jgi:hypothetical protein
MKCALEKTLNGCWIPIAIRYQRFTADELRRLNRGLEIVRDGTTWRRRDYSERVALSRAISASNLSARIS